MICNHCSTVVEAKAGKKGDLLPRGWKRERDGSPVCDRCWRGRYMLRAVTVPIAEVVTDRDAFQSALYAGWEASTAAANLAVHTLFRADVVRVPGMVKLPPMPRVYLYGELKGQTAMDPRALVALLHAVEGKYRACRFGVIWKRDEAPPCFRYPMPYPMPEDQFGLSIDAGGAMVCELRLGGAWHTVRLAQGKGHRRAAGLIRGLISGEGKPVELTLLQAKNKAWMCKIVAWIKRPERAAVMPTKSMHVATGGGRFLSAVIEHGEPWNLNADHVARWIAEHDSYRSRMSEDLKHEKRWPTPTRERMNAAVATRCDRQNARLKNWIGQASKMLVQYAARRGVAVITYDDTDQSFAQRFPWFALRDAIAYKCDEQQIRFERSSAPKTTVTARTEDAGNKTNAE